MGLRCAKIEWEYYLHYGQASPPEFPAIFGHDVEGPEAVLHVYERRKVSGCRQGFVAMVHAPPAHRSSRLVVQQYDSDWLDAFDSIKQVRYGSGLQTTSLLPTRKCSPTSPTATSRRFPG